MHPSSVWLINGKEVTHILLFLGGTVVHNLFDEGKNFFSEE